MHAVRNAFGFEFAGTKVMASSIVRVPNVEQVFRTMQLVGLANRLGQFQAVMTKSILMVLMIGSVRSALTSILHDETTAEIVGSSVL